MGIELNRACAHVKASGDTCGSYALRGSNVCYWHHKARESREERGVANRRARAKTTGIVLPLLEDANSIQVAIQMVAQAVADRRITRSEAGMLLYSVQLAIMNLKNMELPEAVYSRRTLIVPTEGDAHEDLLDTVEIPQNEDPEFEEDEDPDDDGDDVEDSEEEIESAERFVRENIGRLNRLGAGTLTG